MFFFLNSLNVRVTFRIINTLVQSDMMSYGIAPKVGLYAMDEKYTAKKKLKKRYK